MTKVIDVVRLSVFGLVLLSYAYSNADSQYICDVENSIYGKQLDYDVIISMPEYELSVSEIQADIGFEGVSLQDTGDDYYSGARFLAALWVLKHAGDGSTPVLDDAYRFVVDRVKKIKGVCSTSWHRLGVKLCGGDDIACYHGHVLGGEGTVHINKGYLYYSHVLSLAATLVHEARHGDNDIEDFLKNNTHPGWPKGPYAYETQWLSWFSANANPIFSNQFREIAAYLANNKSKQQGFSSANTIKANTGVSLGYPLNINQGFGGLPQLVDNDCSMANWHITTSNLVNIATDLASAQAYCGECDIVTVTQPLTGGSLEHEAIDISCGVGQAGQIVSEQNGDFPFSWVAIPAVLIVPDGSQCLWNSSPLYGVEGDWGSYYKYAPVGDCSFSIKVVVANNDSNSIVEYW